MEDESFGKGGNEKTPCVHAPKTEEQKNRRKKGAVDHSMLKILTLTTLSGEKASEKFSFGKAERFPSASKSIAMRLQRCKSSPAWSGQTSTTMSDLGGPSLTGPSTDFTSAEPSRILSNADPAVDEALGDCEQILLGSEADDFYEYEASTTIMRHAPPPAEDRLFGPRLDGSLDRLGEPSRNNAVPLAKHYDPIQSIGASTSLTYNYSPHYSFGGGPSRVGDLEDKKKEHLAHITNRASSRKSKGRPSAVTLMDLKEAISSSKKKWRASLSRGFGSDISRAPSKRPRWSGPGPGAYDVERDGDQAPVWRTVSHGPHCAWSKRSAARPVMRNLSGNPANVGPGDHITDIEFKAAGPSPILGHPASDIAKPDFPGLDPACHDLPSTLCRDRSPIHSIGSGKRPGLNIGLGASPGPARYFPIRASTAPAVSIGKSIRQHDSELIDADEPPGPGAHNLRKDPKPSDKPSAGLPKDARMRHGMPGMGPPGPGPGAAFGSLPSFLDHRGQSMGMLLQSSTEYTIGPADTAGDGDPHTTDHLTYAAAPAWASLVSRTESGRKPPPKVVKQPLALKSGEELIVTSSVPNEFKPTGPKWSMLGRRAANQWNAPPGADSMIMTTSLG